MIRVGVGTGIGDWNFRCGDGRGLLMGRGEAMILH